MSLALKIRGLSGLVDGWEEVTEPIAEEEEEAVVNGLGFVVEDAFGHGSHPSEVDCKDESAACVDVADIL